MTQKERLIDLLCNIPKIDFPKGSRAQGKSYQTASNIADHLLANGVVVVDTAVVSPRNRPLISQCMGHPLDEIIDLIRAKEEGRIFIPPCKVGTHLWRVTQPYRQEPKVTEFVVKNFRTTGKKHKLQIEVQAVNVPVTNWMRFSDFHTTKEKAEKELAERKTNEMQSSKIMESASEI